MNYTEYIKKYQNAPGPIQLDNTKVTVKESVLPIPATPKAMFKEYLEKESKRKREKKTGFHPDKSYIYGWEVSPTAELVYDLIPGLGTTNLMYRYGATKDPKDGVPAMTSLLFDAAGAKVIDGKKVKSLKQSSDIPDEIELGKVISASPSNTGPIVMEISPEISNNLLTVSDEVLDPISRQVVMIPNDEFQGTLGYLDYINMSKGSKADKAVVETIQGLQESIDYLDSDDYFRVLLNNGFTETEARGMLVLAIDDIYKQFSGRLPNGQYRGVHIFTKPGGLSGGLSGKTRVKPASNGYSGHQIIEIDGTADDIVSTARHEGWYASQFGGVEETAQNGQAVSNKFNTHNSKYRMDVSSSADESYFGPILEQQTRVKAFRNFCRKEKVDPEVIIEHVNNIQNNMAGAKPMNSKTLEVIKKLFSSSDSDINEFLSVYVPNEKRKEAIRYMLSSTAAMSLWKENSQRHPAVDYLTEDPEEIVYQ